jgi:hypothetical protein
MNQPRTSICIAATLTALALLTAHADDAPVRSQSPGGSATQAGGSKHLRHVVLFKFKDSSAEADVDRIVAAFRGLPAKIAEIKEFEWGTDVSPEGKSQGFTHCFVVTFASAADRDAYIPHPAHKEFVAILKPHLDKVCVVDFWSQPGQ